MGYDIIGDVHGQASKLEALLEGMGYRLKAPSILAPMSGENRSRSTCNGFSRRQVLVITSLHSGTCRSADSVWAGSRSVLTRGSALGAAHHRNRETVLACAGVVNSFPTMATISRIVAGQ